jgi:predicted amidohydrolase
VVKLKIALIQMDVCVGQPEVNLAKVRGLAAQSRDARADLLLLPELWLYGYDLERSAEWAHVLGKGGFATMARLAHEFGLYLAGTLLERHEGGVSNTAAFYNPDGSLIGFYRKIHLFRLMQEHRYLVAGDQAKLFPTPWGLVGIPICYDLRFPELFRAMALAGAVLFLVPAQWPAVRLEAWLTLVRARAIENEVFVASCNRVGLEGDAAFPGRSQVVGPLGEVLVVGDDQSGVIIAEIDLNEVKVARRYMPVYEDRRPSAYRVKVAGAGQGGN